MYTRKRRFEQPRPDTPRDGGRARSGGGSSIVVLFWCLYLSVCISLSVSLCLYLSICISVYLSLCLGACCFRFLFVCVSLSLSLSLRVCVFLPLFIDLCLKRAVCPGRLVPPREFGIRVPQSLHLLASRRVASRVLEQWPRSSWLTTRLSARMVI